MKKLLTPIIVLAVLTGCKRENDIGLNAGNISSIDVIEFDKQSQTKKVNDRKLISQLVDCLNHASKELNKFDPSYKLVFHTKTGDISATIRENALHMDTGYRYMAGCNIEQLIQ